MSGPTPPSGSTETPAAVQKASTWWPFGTSDTATPPPAQKKDGMGSPQSSLETAKPAEDPTKMTQPPVNPEADVAAKTTLEKPEPTDSKEPPKSELTPPPAGPTTWYGKAWASLSAGCGKVCSSLWSCIKWLVSPCSKFFSRTTTSSNLT